METPTSRSVEFRCGLNGLISKQAPDLLTNSQYRDLLNVSSIQEGSVSSRLGIKKVGQISSGLNTCYFIRKLVVSNTEDPFVPSTNPRYLGVLTTGPARNIYRTTDYNATTLVVSGADTNAARHWEMADYSAGETGAPWAYFACPNGMFKDSGIAPSGTLPKWGIQPACGVALAVSVLAGSTGVSAISVVDAYQDRGATGPVAVFITAVPGGVASGVADGDVVTLNAIGIVPNTCSTGNGLYYAKVIGYSNSISDPYYPGNGQGSVFGLYDSNGQGVLPSGAFTPGGTVSGIASGGNLNGGASSSPNNTQAYDWIFTYQETSTADEGNPSQAMLVASTATDTIGGIVYSGFPLTVNGGQVRVAVWGTGVAGIGSIKIYRRGGALTDGIYRLIATVANPGSETAVTVVDNTADADLVYAQQGPGVFNPPPVTSTLQTPIKTTATAGISVGWQTVTVAASVLGPVLPGTKVHILDPAGSEDVTVESATGTTFRAYFQLAHSVSGGTPIEIDAITGAYCNLVITMQDAMLVAGDPNNPHVLYKSATGTPQYFPVGLDAAGAVTSIGVGTPSNGIVNMCEFRGQVLTLNVSNLFEIAIINGSLILPAKVADKGLAAQSAWCKTDTEVWFLSDDGIYSWDGGNLRKRSIQIDGIFKGLQVNNIPPLVYEPNVLQLVRMEFRGGYVRLGYTSYVVGLTELVCEPEFGDRWTIVRDSDILTNPNKGTTMLYREPDTKSLVVAGYNPGGAVFGLVDASQTAVGGPSAIITSDWWSSAANADGSLIPWSITLPWFDMGQPNRKKVFEEIWLDIDPELFSGIYSNDSTIQIQLLLDFSDSPVDTATITTAGTLAGRQLMAMLPLLSSVAGTYESFGREARAISFVISGAAYPFPQTLFGVVIQYQDTGLLTAGGSTDWDNLGAETDKRLYQMKVLFDVEGTNQTIVLDTINGINGNTYNPAVQSFVLSNPILTGAGPGRAMKVFPVNDQTIAKLVRVRPVASVQVAATLATVFFKIHSVTFDKEVYPADIVTQTTWTNGGYEYKKYANQVDLQVNTNNVLVTVQLQADNGTVFTFQVNGIITDRQRNVTVPAGIAGFFWRLYVDPNQTAIVSGGGQFQLFAHSIKFEPADKGEVAHTMDWDDLGHPFDKLLITVVFEYDTTLGGPITLQMDTLTGIGGVTYTADVQEFTLGSGRGKTEFAIVADTIVKMIRIYPKGATIPAGYKQWKYAFTQANYPPDQVQVTEWRDLSEPNSKEPSWLWLDADTANVAATVHLQNENGTVVTVQHTGTTSNRKKNYPIPADTYAKMWRLQIPAVAGGKYQQWGWGFERWHKFEQVGEVDPPEVLLFTPWQDFGWPYGTTARNLILVINTGGVTCAVALESQENGIVQTFPINTTYTTRRVIIACDPYAFATQWRLLLTPGTGGLSQLWEWALEVIKEPASVTFWDSLEQSFGYKFWKFCKQGWFLYFSNAPITISAISDTGTFSVTLPAHPRRSEERFLFPTVWGSGLNKSLTYRVQITSSATFRFYAEGSGIEWLGLGEDRHSAYRQMTFSEMMTLGEGG